MTPSSLSCLSFYAVINPSVNISLHLFNFLSVYFPFQTMGITLPIIIPRKTKNKQTNHKLCKTKIKQNPLHFYLRFSFHLSIFLSFLIFSLSLSLHLSACLSLYIPLSIHHSIYPSIYLSISLFTISNHENHTANNNTTEDKRQTNKLHQLCETKTKQTEIIGR